MLLQKYVIKVSVNREITDEELDELCKKLDEIDIYAGISAVIERADRKLNDESIVITCDEV